MTHIKHQGYVSEPEAIDLSQLAAAAPGDYLSLTPGTPTFTGSKEKLYDTLIIRSETIVTDTIKQHFPSLKNIVRVGTGLDNVDLEYCNKEAIAVYNAAGANADAVGEYLVAVMLYTLRRMHLLTNDDVANWNRFKFIGASISAQTVGLVGFGNIGRALYKRLQGFEVANIIVYDPYLTQSDLPEGMRLVQRLDDLLTACTVISLHVPLTSETSNLIGKRELGLLQPGVVLINASRGGIVDETAVVELLGNSPTLTYVADTVTNEPNVNPDLLTNRNIYITPHMASLTREAGTQMIQTAIKNFLAGRAVQL